MTLDVLGIPVPPALLDKWAEWLAPDPQPFLVDSVERWSDCAAPARSMAKELVDTYQLYGVARDSAVVWISEATFNELPRPRRAALVREQVVRTRGAVPTVRGWGDLLNPVTLRAQADGHRFVWWPSLLATNRDEVLRRVVSERRLASRHQEVGESTWRKCHDVLPDARALAGTFPAGSDSCCFGAVMAAAGADDARACESLDAFEEWLAAACRKGASGDDAGTVLVWRKRDGDLMHAAVVIGDGWALEKPSGDWHSPRAVAAVADVIRMSRHPGERLERHTILA